MAGSRYQVNAKDTLGIDVPGHTDFSRASCESCHGSTPHDRQKLDDHVDTLACQTCHVPAFARGGVATKMWWDWSTAGRLDADSTGLMLWSTDRRFVERVIGPSANVEKEYLVRVTGHEEFSDAQFAEAVGHHNTMGICCFGEQGMDHKRRACHGNLMFGCLLFSNKPRDGSFVVKQHTTGGQVHMVS